MASKSRRILDATGVARSMDTLASEILFGGDLDTLALIGIRRRGVPIALRVAAAVARISGVAPRTGALDITLYRDDLTLVADQPRVSKTEVDFPVDKMRVVLVDDVLFTGRTVRAAIDALFALGRPAKIELAVLADRGFREIPIEATFAAHRVHTTLREIVKVHIAEVDGADYVEVLEVEGDVK